jgi:1,4-dihydroxy-6-naphthoate synthase
MDAVLDGSVEAGLVIDGGQMTYSKIGLTKILDLGIWWYDQTGLPLPLGGNIVRRDLPETIIVQLVLLLKQSVRYALEHRQEAIDYAMRYSQGMSKEQAMLFIGRYVNELTLDYGDEGKTALNELFKRGHAAGVIQKQMSLEFV